MLILGQILYKPSNLKRENINEIEEDDLKMDRIPFINNDMSDLISSITSDSSVYENGDNQEYFSLVNQELISIMKT